MKGHIVGSFLIMIICKNEVNKYEYIKNKYYIIYILKRCLDQNLT